MTTVTPDSTLQKPDRNLTKMYLKNDYGIKTLSYSCKMPGKALFHSQLYPSVEGRDKEAADNLRELSMDNSTPQRCGGSEAS